MTRNEARVYRVRYTIAEAIFKIAAWVKPANYEFDAVRDAVHTMLLHLPEEALAMSPAQSGGES